MAAIRGHGLEAEGAGFNARRERLRMGTGGPGRALCKCGALSEWMQSGAERKRWHDAHKQALPAEQLK